MIIILCLVAAFLSISTAWFLAKRLSKPLPLTMQMALELADVTQLKPVIKATYPPELFDFEESATLRNFFLRIEYSRTYSPRGPVEQMKINSNFREGLITVLFLRNYDLAYYQFDDKKVNLSEISPEEIVASRKLRELAREAANA